MEVLTHIVNESLARHGYEPTLDHRRLAWSVWMRCEGRLTALSLPARPGILAIGEEVIAPGESGAADGKRMLALLSLKDAEDLSVAMERMFQPGSPEREQLLSGRAFIRYTRIDDANQRRKVIAALQDWMASSVYPPGA